MKKIIFPFLLIIVIFCTAYSTYKISYFIAENYFFDKLFYKKSKDHGYLSCDTGDCSLERFKDSSKDLRYIKDSGGSFINQTVLGKSSNDPYKIAIIGDSYVWGEGVKNDKTVSPVLEDKLNKIKNTQVFQLGWPGDSILSNYEKYKLIQQRENIDLYVFVLVDNDLMFRPQAQHDSNIFESIISRCRKPYDNITYNQNENVPGYDHDKIKQESFENPQNICVLNEVISLLPKANAIYFSSYPPSKNYPLYQKYARYLEDEELYILSSDKGEEMNEYKKYWENHKKYFTVSQKEPHPSNLAHKMFADILFEEITINPRWNF